MNIKRKGEITLVIINFILIFITTYRNIDIKSLILLKIYFKQFS